MVNEGKFTLIGPETSVGNMHLGPLFYYLMLPFFFLFGTVGPSVETALFGGATAFLLWWVGREWFSEKAGLMAAFLYAVSPVAIALSRSAWNPNVMPFFALLAIWGVWWFWQKDRYWGMVMIGLGCSVAIQSHYMGLLLLPIAGLFWLLKLKELLKTKNRRIRSFLVWTGLGIMTFFVLSILPLIWFDLRHNFINYKAFFRFFTERQATVSLKPYKAIPQLWPLWQMMVTRLLAGKDVGFGSWLAPVLFSLVAIITFLLVKNPAGKKERNGLFLLLGWILIGLWGMGLYKQHIYDHYFGFLLPAIFLLAGMILEKLWLTAKVGKILALGGLISVTYFAFRACPLRENPHFQVQQTAAVSQKIAEEANGRPFNIGLIARQNYDTGYRYFLEKSGQKPVFIDAQKTEETITEQLFVICEDPVCLPINHPQAEIANFGWSKIEKEWTFPWGVKLFKLVHNKDGEK
jgi:4-amino-4-deoxy-L-arabinose transferase-like glycosyltransferase